MCRVYPCLPPVLRTIRSMDMQGIRLSITSSLDVQGVCLSNSMDLQGASLSTTSSMDVQGICLFITSNLDVQGVCLSTISSVDMQAVPLKTFIQFFETPKCQTFRERSVFYWTEKEHRCRNQSGTGRREPSLALKCLGTGLRCWMTEC